MQEIYPIFRNRIQTACWCKIIGDLLLYRFALLSRCVHRRWRIARKYSDEKLSCKLGSFLLCASQQSGKTSRRFIDRSLYKQTALSGIRKLFSFGFLLSRSDEISSRTAICGSRHSFIRNMTRSNICLMLDDSCMR